MAELTKTDAPGAYVSALTALTMTAGSTSADTFTLKKNDILVAHNTGGSAYTITITSVAAEGVGNRSGDITTHSIPAGAIHIWGPARLQGWQNGSGKLEVTVSNAAVELGIIEQE